MDYLGSAYGEGLVKARGDFVILMDADLSHHVSYPSFVPSITSVAL